MLDDSKKWYYLLSTTPLPDAKNVGDSWLSEARLTNGSDYKNQRIAAASAAVKEAELALVTAQRRLKEARDL